MKTNLNFKKSEFKNKLLILSSKKGDLTMTELVMIIVGITLLLFVIFVVIPNATSESCKGIAKLFGSC